MAGGRWLKGDASARRLATGEGKDTGATQADPLQTARDYFGAVDTAGLLKPYPESSIQHPFSVLELVLRAYKLNCVKIYICFGIL